MSSYVKGSFAIKLDVLTLEHKLSERQKLALEAFITRKDGFTIREYEGLCPGTHRRSLQRDLSDLLEKGLISQEGSRKSTLYRVNPLD